MTGSCNCYSYNGDFGEKPEVALPKPEWSSRNGDTIMVDACIADTVKAIWDAGYITLSSCCGHGRDSPSLVLGESSDSSPEIIAAIREVIDRTDGRTFRLYRWELTER